jgi:hypothetical protein
MRIFAARNLAFRFVAILVILVALTSGSGARPSSIRANASAPKTQGEDGRVALKTDDGVLFVWNRKDLGFTLAIKGRDVKPLDAGENVFFTINGLVLQIQSLPIGNFAPGATKDKLDDKAILLAHRDWESKFIAEELLHRKLVVESSSLKIANGSEALIWQFDVPRDLGGDAKKQVYLSVVRKDYLILLNGVVNDAASEETVRKFLLDTINTLKTSDSPMDVKKLQESIRVSGQS